MSNRRSPRYDPDPDEDNIRARFYPGFDSEVVVTKDDEIHLFTEGKETTVPMESAEDVYAILEFVRHLQDQETTGDAPVDDEVLLNISSFTGIFKFIAKTAENSYLNPPERTQSDYEAPSDEQ